MGTTDSQHLFIKIGAFWAVLDESVTVARHYREVNIKAGTRSASRKGGQTMEVRPMTRHQRRTGRLKSLTTAREAHRAAIRAGLDYRVSGESGALIVHTHSLSWHRAKNPNITVPPTGRGGDGTGPAPSS